MRGKGHLFVFATIVGFSLALDNGYGTLYLFVFLICLMIWWVKNRLTLLEIGVLLIVSLFFSVHFSANTVIHEDKSYQTEMIIGEVRRITNRQEDFTTFYFKSSCQNELLQVIDTNHHSPDYEVGNHYRLTGVYQEIERPTNPGQFNYRSYLSRQGISWQFQVNESELMALGNNRLTHRLLRLREELLVHMTTTHSEFNAGWIRSLVLGDRHGLDDGVEQIFQNWHLTHLLAISGLHISILIALILFTGLFVFRMTKTSTYMLILLVLVLFPFIAGGAPSVFRASVVSAIVVLLWFSDIHLKVIDYLSLTFILLLIISPNWIYHLGFQFSFLITYSIILSQKVLSSLPHIAYQSIYLTLLSTFIVIPIQIHHFHLFNPLSIVINVVWTWYFSIWVVPLAFILFFISFIMPTLITPLAYLFELTHRYSMTLLSYINETFYFKIVVGEFPAIYMIIFYSVMMLVLIHLEKRQWKKLKISIFLLMMTLGFVLIRPYLNPYGTVTMLDLGQSDALIVELPHRKSVIIYDLGAPYHINQQEVSSAEYNNVIKPFLYQAGIQKIDAVILSHEHIDHVGSVPFLVDDFKVKRFITSPYFEWIDELTSVKKSVSSIETYGMSDTFDINGQVFHVISPERDYHDANDNSLVVLTSINELNWLLTGDLSSVVEEQILNAYTQLPVDILSISHHGSDTSSSAAFLDAIAIDVGLISVGRYNRYQHPSDRVIQDLIARNVTIYRTDQNGAVQFKFHKNRPGTFMPFHP
ncbi:competence protein ComEC [Pelagirhabdus alkalitolerans]|uniref:Competence protein ComEC n=1 Tax=Pelagirhabdus alkalitolerans TaxID=1612202 RepID=A0A1G6HWB5_9BACI|nr:DNA internalization-related competence protein ComEC/Rec2 [Pelagirhabdus alkalitolerans]SDB97756.1 competence protein ComEC [Pelagirhabdus alkalitolerans]